MARLYKKDILSRFDIVLEVGYCDLQEALRGKEKIGHTERREGWGMDVYDLGNGIGLVTGYDSLKGAKVVPYRISRKYEEEAEKIDWYKNDRFKEQLNDILDRFVKEALEV